MATERRLAQRCDTAFSLLLASIFLALHQEVARKAASHHRLLLALPALQRNKLAHTVQSDLSSETGAWCAASCLGTAFVGGDHVLDVDERVFAWLCLEP